MLRKFYFAAGLAGDVVGEVAAILGLWMAATAIFTSDWRTLVDGVVLFVGMASALAWRFVQGDVVYMGVGIGNWRTWRPITPIHFLVDVGGIVAGAHFLHKGMLAWGIGFSAPALALLVIRLFALRRWWAGNRWSNPAAFPFGRLSLKLTGALIGLTLVLAAPWWLVFPSRLRAEAPPKLPDTSIMVLWHGKPYRAQQIDSRGDQIKVHYVGYSASWDEWVPRSRVVPKAAK